MVTAAGGLPGTPSHVEGHVEGHAEGLADGLAEGLDDEVVAGAQADPVVTRVRQALADVGAEADVVVLDHAPRSLEDLAAEVGAPAGALVRCTLLLVAEDPCAEVHHGEHPALPLAPTPQPEAEGDLRDDAGAGPTTRPVRAVMVLAPAESPVRAADVAEAAAGLGAVVVRPAPGDVVRDLTGTDPDETPPVGTAADGRLVVEAVLVDTTLGAHERLWTPAGRAGTVLTLGHDELLRITLGHPVERA
ncbi:YbaK/EbsC family protein [Pseudokineococcus sp. 1T1Z-3]|uniref:YbaK/EbsC family protein n=1 Tax=Pseudokineococcus sp. 1T1Z-3 TaxID=3132745 RepID=UPI0030A43BA3